MKRAYVEYVILEYIQGGNFDAQFNGGWVDANDFDEILAQLPSKAFAVYGIRAIGKYSDIAEAIAAALIKEGGISIRGDQYAGSWHRLNISKKNSLAKIALDNNEVNKRLAGLPEIAFSRALNEVAREDGLLALDAGEDGVAKLSDTVSAEVIPASDRVVSLQHNQRSEIENPLNEVLNLVEVENSVDGEDGLRELIVGRLRAGRELIRAGVFSIKSLQFTLVVGLQMLVEKYREMTIGIVAAQLLDLLLKQYGIG